MAHSDLFAEILLVAGAAFIGGYIAHSLRLPTIIGFLAAGMLIGPNTPGPTPKFEDVELVAELGVIFLMFGLGVQVSFKELISMRRIALTGGIAQVLLTTMAGIAAAPLLGLTLQQGVLLGFLAAISSTVVALRLLEARDEATSIHGRAAVALLIFQDLAVVIMLLILPSLGGEGVDLGGFGFALVKGAGLLAGTYVVGVFVIPHAWRNIALRRSRDLSLLASLLLAIGLATGSALLGLSIAFGAFLAGLAISESEFGHQTLSDILPLREVFSTVFFVAIGMLMEPEVLLEEPALVFGLILLVVVVKGVVTTGVVRAVGLTGAPAIMTGAAMAQVGEFSFVLTRAGIEEAIISSELAAALLLGSAITILVNPGIFIFSESAVGVLRQAKALKALMGEDIRPIAVDDRSMNRHVIIGGYGRTGRALARSLAGRRLPYVLVDSNPYLADQARVNDQPFIFGDISRPEVLELANIRGARALALTIDDEPAARVAMINARFANPRIDIVARGFGAESHSVLRDAGASEVVDAEFESAQEFVRHVLHRFGVDAREIVALQASRRTEHYRATEKV